jgi:hypothetical protein
MATGAFQLWRLDTGNCVGAFDDESAALAEVRAGVRADGREAWANTALLQAGDEAGDIRPIAEGDELVERALVPQRATA